MTKRSAGKTEVETQVEEKPVSNPVVNIDPTPEEKPIVESTPEVEPNQK